jgi:L-iditol 2-dehydrogenase
MDEGFNPGGFAEYIAIPPRIVQGGMFSVPENLPLEQAALCEPLGCCLHGLEAVNINPEDRLLIIGDGPMGLLQAECARALGVKKIVLVGMTPARMERAARVASEVIDANQGKTVECLHQIFPKGADKVLLSVGNSALVEDAFANVAKGGTVNLFAGLPGGTKLNIDPYRIHYDEVKLVGTFGFTPQNFKFALELLTSGKVNLEGIITSIVPIQNVLEAIQNVSEYRGIKSVVRFGEEVAMD